MKNRIAILGTRGIPARYGGFETFAEELALRLVKKDVDVTVYCEAGNNSQPSSYQGISLVYLSSPSCGPITTILFDLLCLWHARKGHDIVYMLGYGAAPFCFIPQLWGSKVWLNVDGIEWARAKWSVLAKLYFRAMEWFSTWIPDRIIADAEGIKDHLARRHRRLPPCQVIAYGAPILETAPDPLPLQKWTLSPNHYYLIVCRLEPENHIREIIEGFNQGGSSYPLIIVGNDKADSAYVESLLALASERVRFIGTVYDKVLINTLRFYATAYFHGHSVGGTNPSLLEALGCGNLTIAHDNVFNREVIGQKGYFFQSASEIKDYMAAIEGLSEGQRLELGDAARNRIRERYNWDSIAQQYLDLIKEETSGITH
jgi:glycosyltransferase involved in cell wall biosynthesis